MEIINAALLDTFGEKHADAAKPLLRWRDLVLAESWRSLIEVRRTFPTADGIRIASGLVVTVFNIGGNKYRLITSIIYGLQIVDVIDVLTHAEYSRNVWQSRL